MATDQDRISALENEVVDLKIRTKVNELAIGELKDTVKEIKGNTSKIVWLVGSAVILAVLNLIIKGGVL